MREQKNYYKKVSPTKFEINWNTKYSQLKDFKARFGHCNVPQQWIENRSLGRWVIRQRVYKKRLAPERIEKLDAIGFTWSIPDYAWEKNFNELIELQKKTGHSHVSKGDHEQRKLAEWLSKQRQDKKKHQTRLPENKITKLNAIGVEWEFYSRHGWENQYHELVKFKERYGHCRVLQRWKENQSLANWVSIQRRDKNNLRQEQIELLNAIGFIWSIKPRKNKTEFVS